MLLREIKDIYHLELDTQYEREEVASFFYLLIEHHLKLERFILAMQPNLVVSKDDETSLFAALSRLKLQEPIQHIIGKTHFMEMDFRVTKDVLIPRPETEELIRWMLDELRVKSSELRVLDIGTGSGCIAISLAKHLPEAKVYALDVSKEALEVAKKNAELNNVNLIFIKQDILESERELERELELELEFDVIVSNPPYVRELEKKEMHKNVLEHEPDLALFVSDENPLVFYKKITAFASQNLRVGGTLFFEINQYLGKETKQLLKDHNFSEIELRKDMFENDRMLMGVKKT
ncbi:MAG: peptide chain release factor N(5)-glutamine methyltransferase [Maribacter sp.]